MKEKFYNVIKDKNMNNKITINISNDLIQIRMNIYSDTTTYKTESKLKRKNEELKNQNVNNE